MEGFYFDPKHGGCLRRVRRVASTTYHIDGVYGDDEAVGAGAPWHAIARVVARPKAGVLHLKVLFVGKQKQRCTYDAAYAERTLHWDDGNAWNQMYVHTPSQIR